MGDGINDRDTRAAMLAEVGRVRVPMLEGYVLGRELGFTGFAGGA